MDCIGTTVQRGMAAALLLLAGTGMLAPMTGPSRAQSAAEAEILAAGDPVVEVRIDSDIGAARIRAAIDVPAPPGQVWAAILDCATTRRVVPGMESCRVIERDPGGRWDIREHIVNWAWFLPRVRNVFRSDYAPPQRLTFRKVDGDLRLSSGEWRLEPQNNGQTTRLFYHSIVAATVPVPSFIAIEALRRDLTTVMTNLRGAFTARRQRTPPS